MRQRNYTHTYRIPIWGCIQTSKIYDVEYRVKLVSFAGVFESVVKWSLLEIKELSAVYTSTYRFKVASDSHGKNKFIGI